MLVALAMLFSMFSKSASNQDGMILAMQRFYTEETSNFMLVYMFVRSQVPKRNMADSFSIYQY